jgi:DNA-directed RNA polymerase specialized sigma24 family protein
MLVLHYWHGITLKEIAFILGISHQALQSRMATLLKKLRRYLHRTYPEFEEESFLNGSSHNAH